MVITVHGLNSNSLTWADVMNTLGGDTGGYDITFDAAGLTSGVYLYRIQAGGFVQTKKLVAVK
jgi:hypothetical protein